MSHPYSEVIWTYLKGYIGNDYGVAGLMGNLQAESGLYPDRVQGDVPYSNYSKEYTAKVDSGAISKNDFVNNGPNGNGYGLAQWTYPARKQLLYEWYKSYNYSSIGSIELALDYLVHELEYMFPSVWRVLRSATSIKQASNSVLHDFENPANQSASVENSRAALGVAWYNAYSGTLSDEDYGEAVDPDIPVTPVKPVKKKPMSKLLLYSIALE